MLDLDPEINRFFKLKKAAVTQALHLSAETEGFEPSIQFPVYTLSRRAPSTTRTSLQKISRQIYDVIIIVQIWFTTNVFFF